jgi:hypothetical protein
MRKETMKELVNFKTAEVFRVKETGKNGYSGESLYTQESLEYNHKWYKDKEFTVLESVGSPNPAMQLYRTGRTTANCYVQIDYELHSDVELNELELDKLRANHAFMYGQRTGHLLKSEVVDGKHVYHLVSECDSGD